MQKTIVMAQEKGGSGKTTIAEEIAFFLDRKKIPYNLYDLDHQGSMIHKEVRNEHAVINIVDTQGALNGGLQDALREADLVIIPLRMNPRDAKPLTTTIRQAYRYAPKAKIIFVINFWNRFNAGKDFLKWFNEAYPHAKVATLSQSEAFAQAAFEEMSVVDYKRNPVPGEQIKELMRMIMCELGMEDQND